jgi:uncharacterized protein YkwD
VKRSRVVPLAIAAVVIVLGVGIFAVLRSTQPGYVNAGDGIALGPAARRTSSATDFLAQLATGALSTAAGSSGGDLATIEDTAPNAQEQALLDQTNSDRAQFGLPPVAFDPPSIRVARLRAAAQTPGSPLSHYNSLGEMAFTGLLADAGVPYTLAGENLARASSQSSDVVTRLAEALMNSPTHRANILEPSFNRLAVGAANGSDGGIAFAEIFRSAVDVENQAQVTATVQ